MAIINTYLPMNMHAGFDQNLFALDMDFNYSKRFELSDWSGNSYEFSGYDFEYSGYAHDAIPVSGTVTGWEFFYTDFASGDLMYASEASGLSVPVADIYRATDTGTASDDIAIYQKALAGDDELIGSDYLDVLDGFDGNDSLSGWGGDDYLYGSAGTDFLNGMEGRDVLNGGAGTDFLTGGEGRDYLYGESGDDVFVFDTSPKIRDKIGDFNVRDGDMIFLDNADFRGIGHNGKFKASAFHVNKTGKAHDASDRVIYDKDSGKLYYDSDGTGAKAAVCFSDIGKHLKISATDFWVI